MNQDEWVETLSKLADVALAAEDFDMDELCDRVQPDFILYESPGLDAENLKIENPAAHAGIPRFGFQMQDPQCSTRVGFLRVVEKLNIQWIFTHLAEASIRQSPELKDRTFSVSLLFDDAVFRDYGLPKDIPVSVFGASTAPEIYHWRTDVVRDIADHFPTFIYTHPGYRKPTPRHKFPVVGEAYARLLNRSYFSLADTTRFDYLVRKHLEIPASGAVLVSPDTPALKPYGFKDMENCVLGKGRALFDKIAALADNPDLYERIRKNGHDLAHGKYTGKNWRGILDFYECFKTLKPGETIQQQGFLGPFKIVPLGAVPLPAIAADCPDSEISLSIKDWLQSLLNGGSLNDMESRLSKMADWIYHVEESFVPLGIMMLLKGDTGQAIELLQRPQAARAKSTEYNGYDPEEIAWLSLAASLSGNTRLISLTRKESAPMRHRSLRRMQWLGQILAAGRDASNPPPDVGQSLPGDRLSVHWLGQIDLQDWLNLIRRILEANGQSGILRIDKSMRGKSKR
jgi:hypothetical protein